MEDPKSAGRPEIGPKYQVTLPESVAEEVDELSRRNGITRSEQLRLLIMSGLESTGPDDEGRPGGLKPRLLYRGALVLLDALGQGDHPVGFTQVTKALELLANPDTVTQDEMWSAAVRMTTAVKSISSMAGLSEQDRALMRRAIVHAVYVLTRPWLRDQQD